MLFAIESKRLTTVTMVSEELNRAVSSIQCLERIHGDGLYKALPKRKIQDQGGSADKDQASKFTLMPFSSHNFQIPLTVHPATRWLFIRE